MVEITNRHTIIQCNKFFLEGRVSQLESRLATPRGTEAKAYQQMSYITEELSFLKVSLEANISLFFTEFIIKLNFSRQLSLYMLNYKTRVFFT